MTPYHTPQEERERIYRRARGIVIVSNALNTLPRPITTEAMMAEIERQCAGDRKLLTTAYAVLASAMLNRAQSKAKESEVQA